MAACPATEFAETMPCRLPCTPSLGVAAPLVLWNQPGQWQQLKKMIQIQDLKRIRETTCSFLKKEDENMCMLNLLEGCVCIFFFPNQYVTERFCRESLKLGTPTYTHIRGRTSALLYFLWIFSERSKVGAQLSSVCHRIGADSPQTGYCTWTLHSSPPTPPQRAISLDDLKKISGQHNPIRSYISK